MFPIYDDVQKDVEKLVQMCIKLNPFDGMKKEDIEKNGMQESYELFNRILSHFTPILEPGDDIEKKDENWDALCNELDRFIGGYSIFSANEIDDMTKSTSGFNRWQLLQLAHNIRSQMNIIEERSTLENEGVPGGRDMDEFTDMYGQYVAAGNEIDESFAQYDSFENFSETMDRVSSEESKWKKAVEDHEKPFVYNYREKRERVMVNGVPAELNCEQIYDLYDNEYKKQDKIIGDTNAQIDLTIKNMKDSLRKKDNNLKTELDILNTQIKNGQQQYSQISESVLQTIEVGNVSAKLSGDVFEIDKYFDELNAELAKSPFIAILKETRRKKNFADTCKRYLQGLHLKDKYEKDRADIIKELKDYQKATGLDNDDFETLIINGSNSKSFGGVEFGLSAMDEQQAKEENAYKKFCEMKEKYINSFSLKKGDKKFAARVRAIQTPNELVMLMNSEIMNYEGNELNSILNTNAQPGTEEHRIAKACETIESNYKQLKGTKILIEDCNKRIKEINKIEIDPALYEQQRILSDEDVKKYTQLGIKGAEDLKKLKDQALDAVAKKKLAENDRQKHKADRDNYLKELADGAKYEKDKLEANEKYDAIKGSTAKLQQKFDKISTFWRLHEELKYKDGIVKEGVFGESAKPETANTYKNVIEEIEKGLKYFEDSIEVGHDSIFSNSKEYNDMINSIGKLLVHPKDNPNGPARIIERNPERIKAALKNISDMSKKYLDAKKKQIRLLPSRQRRARLTFAENLKVFASQHNQKFADIERSMLGIKEELHKDFEKIERELHVADASDMGAFFKNVIKPRSAAVLRKKAELQQEAEQNRLENKHEEKHVLPEDQNVNKSGQAEENVKHDVIVKENKNDSSVRLPGMF